MEQGDSHEMLLTMAAAISAGVLVIALAHRLRVSAIVLLLLAGIAIGPEWLGIVHPDSLGNALPMLVSLAVGLILFEGGLTLDVKGYRSAPGVIQRLLSFGVLVTWLTTATAIHFLFDHTWEISLLAASLVIVTGPTVIAPLLKRIRVMPKLHSILHWEGVLIDPVGVFVALLCYEWISPAEGSESFMALGKFGYRVVVGLGIGVAGGFAIAQMIRWRLPPRDLINPFALGCALLVFGSAEYFVNEAGLLAVTAAGFVLGLRGPPELKKLKEFKGEITELMIGMLFILLAARLQLERFAEFGETGIVLLAVVLFIVRPLNIAVSSWRGDLTWKEKLFLSWVAPRGIVAASMASLFALRLQAHLGPAAEFLETFTYSVIAATVILQGFSAGPVASVLGVKQPPRRGWLIVGAHQLGRQVARFLMDEAKVDALLIDSNARSVNEARERGLRAYNADARDTSIEEEDDFLQIGYLLALTDNADLNVLLCERWSEGLGRRNVFRWGTPADGHEGEPDAGKLVWSRLPRPSLVSGELASGESRARASDRRPDDERTGVVPLCSLFNGKVSMTPSAEGLPADGEVKTLFLRRQTEYLSPAVDPDLVLTTDSRDLDEILAALVDLVVAKVPAAPRDAMLQRLLNRPDSSPAGLGIGMAVPHIYVEGITEQVCAIARIPNGLELPTSDDEPVRLLFLLVSPAGDPERHLGTLGEIARFAQDPVARQEVLGAKTHEQVIQEVRCVFHIDAVAAGQSDGSR